MSTRYNSVTNFKSVPAKFLAIHSSMRRFSSGLKWFFQSPVSPVETKKEPVKMIYHQSETGAPHTFANESVSRIGQAGFDFHCHVDGLVLGELVDFHVIHELLDLLVGERLVQELGNLPNFAPQILQSFN